jgi:hypothetical protein
VVRVMMGDQHRPTAHSVALRRDAPARRRRPVGGPPGTAQRGCVGGAARGERRRPQRRGTRPAHSDPHPRARPPHPAPRNAADGDAFVAEVRAGEFSGQVVVAHDLLRLVAG